MKSESFRLAANQARIQVFIFVLSKQEPGQLDQLRGITLVN